MDAFETRLRSLPLRQPSEHFGEPGTLAAYRPKWEQPQTVLERINAMPWTSRTAALVGVTAMGLVLYLAFLAPLGMPVAFAQVAGKLAAAKTVSFDSAITRVGDNTTLRKSREYYLVPGKSRQECVFPEQEIGTFLVEDFAAGKSLAVSAKIKTAIVGSIKGAAEIDKARKMMDFLQSLPRKNPRELGEKQLDGVRVKGFEVDSPSTTTTVWADATSGDPVRIEILHKHDRPGPRAEVLTNIKLDEQLDPAMFSVEPPRGYAVRQNASIDLDAGPLPVVARLLETYAKYMDGQFPKALGKDGLEPLFEKLAKSGELKPDQLPKEDDLLQLPANLAFVAAVTSKLKKGERWQYYPGVRLAEKDRIVFWYLDAKTNTYSAVYGDLRVEKAAKDQLPPN